MQVHATELLRRFLLHVLPYRFVRIRYYGLLANRYRRQNIAQCRALLGAADPEPLPEGEGWEESLQRLTGADPMQCPVCGRGRLRLRSSTPRSFPSQGRSPP